MLLATQPNCSTDIGSENHLFFSNISVWCTVDFRGSWRPVMKWNQVDGTPTNSSFTNVTNPNYRTTYSMLMKATKSTNGNKYTCTLYFKKSSILHGDPPDMNWTSHISLTCDCGFNYRFNFLFLFKCKRIYDHLVYDHLVSSGNRQSVQLI